MQDMNRRSLLGLLLGGAAVAAGVVALPGEASAVALPKLEPLAKDAEDNLVQDVQWRPWRRRRRRRRICWRNRRGRLVCAYR
jgi:hypothetical protein